MIFSRSALEEIKPGNDPVIYLHLSDDDYHDSIGLSSTQIKDAMQSRMYFDAKYNKQLIAPSEGLHFNVGRLLHCMVLEPDKVNERFIQQPDVPKPSVPQRVSYDRWVKAGRPDKTEYAQYPTEKALYRCGFWDGFNPNNECVINKDQWTLAEDMATAVKEHAVVNTMLQADDLECEVSYYYRDPETELLLKARPDIKMGDSIADIKTISLRGPVDEEWLIATLRSEIVRRKYHVSAAMYLDVTKSSEFCFIFVNKEPQYHWVAVVKLSDELVTQGRSLYRKTLTNLAIAYRTNEWPEPSSIAPQVDEAGNVLISVI